MKELEQSKYGKYFNVVSKIRKINHLKFQGYYLRHRFHGECDLIHSVCMKRCVYVFHCKLHLNFKGGILDSKLSQTRFSCFLFRKILVHLISTLLHCFFLLSVYNNMFRSASGDFNDILMMNADYFRQCKHQKLYI